ncbi:hypothetical protein RDWZM_009034 [Blomia tropicalis]|uniref:Protein phosphatase 1 regulatory subunit 14B n=1 Tax=Blomia tropicalis TaxID=40697 RepID=A0A9Q0M5M0_BLOTA|nr:hypothetical protein BLOT_012040 [Blomia tropicalis]KAJ6217877.1 hypothetical protein RDWZM_009034 [Blomia tropicalis]
MSARTSTTKPLHHVNFNTENPEMNERKRKYLTAKYGQHQMNLIKKRLKVEMWMYEQLQMLFDTTGDCFDEIEIDLDELLDLECKRRKDWLRVKLTRAKQPKEIVEAFIIELLERANTL